MVLFDIEASKKNKQIDFQYLKDMASEAFMPLAYGGGIRSVKDAQKIFSIGFEKVILNTNAILDNNLVKELVKKFGSQSVVYSLDVKKTFFSESVFIKSATKKIKLKPIEVALKMQELGVGEVILNDIDRDGTLTGYNLELIDIIASKLNIPLIASGGAKDLDSFKLAKESGAHGCAAGSMFVYHMPHRAVVISYPKLPVSF